MMRTVSPKTWLTAFRKDTGGNMSVEFVLMMPMLFLTFMCTYVFFDGYRQSTVNLKAAYTISDLISRETNPVTDEYIDSMHNLLQMMTRDGSATRLRVSVVKWDTGDDKYYLDWSEARGTGMAPMTNNDLLLIEDKLPLMPDNERVIVVETTNTFVPLYGIGMKNIELENFVFTRPRFAPQVIFDNT